MDAATLSLVLAQVGRVLEAEVIFENRKRQMGATSDLRAYLGDDSITVRFGGNRMFVTRDGTTVELDAGAGNAEVAKALNLQKIIDITQVKIMATIAEQLRAARAKLTEAREGATKAVAESHDASNVVLGEVNKVLKEASDLRAEVAELTNGGPA